MPKKVLTVTDARKNLPSLIKQAAEGRGPIFIGPRGEAVVALVSIDQVAAPAMHGMVAESGDPLGAWAPLRLSVSGTWEDIVADKEERTRQYLERLDGSPPRAQRKHQPAATKR